MTHPWSLHEQRTAPRLARDLPARALWPAAAAAGPAVPEEPMPGQGETLLLVDDDSQVRAVLQALLEGLHYRVLAACNGTEALAVYERHGNAIALVLTDLEMPEMGGVELCRALRQRHPRVKILVITASPLGETGHALQEEGVRGWLHKPCALAELAQAVRRAL